MGQLGARFEPSHQMGEFVLRRWLAQGGMAELYLATPADPARAGELVVVKRVLPQFTRNESFARMFSREARLASMLRHPNIVAVWEGGGTGAQDCYFTMEYVHGVDLSVLLDALRDRSGMLPLAHALTIAVSMCKGLHHAHEARGPDGQPLQIVHRDVSPSNVLLSFDGAVKVTDFGVATALAMTRLTEEGTRKGKLAYMSPEQATGEVVDRRADVFAIAAVLYELTTMRRLFDGDNDLAIMYNIVERPRPSPREVSPGYPAALEQIVMRAVSRDPSERFDTALELQQALEEFAVSVGLSLSTEALGRFVCSTVPVPLHPRDDPTLWTTTTALHSASHPVITMVEGTSTPGSGPRGAPSYPTGPIPGLSPAGSTPGMGVPASAAHSGRGPVVARSSASWNAVPAQSSSTMLRWLSIALAGTALLVTLIVVMVVWQSSEPEPTEPAATTPAKASPSSETPQPLAPVVVPTPPPTPAVTEPAPTEPAPTEPAVIDSSQAEPAPTPSPPRKKKRKKHGSSTEPASEPSKKPAPTDTLLPIRQ